MKVTIDADEWYPVYTFDESSEPWGLEVDLPEDVIAACKEAEERFLAAQEILRRAYEEKEEE